jgi:hypothetical protein
MAGAPVVVRRLLPLGDTLALPFEGLNKQHIFSKHGALAVVEGLFWEGDDQKGRG